MDDHDPQQGLLMYMCILIIISVKIKGNIHIHKYLFSV